MPSGGPGARGRLITGRRGAPDLRHVDCGSDALPQRPARTRGPPLRPQVPRHRWGEQGQLRPSRVPNGVRSDRVRSLQRGHEPQPVQPQVGEPRPLHSLGRARLHAPVRHHAPRRLQVRRGECAARVGGAPGAPGRGAGIVFPLSRGPPGAPGGDGAAWPSVDAALDADVAARGAEGGPGGPGATRGPRFPAPDGRPEVLPPAELQDARPPRELRDGGHRSDDRCVPVLLRAQGPGGG